jgi:hypothetical protein
MNLYKKNISLSFLLCLVVMPLLFSVYTIIEQKIIEQQMKEKLEHENLQVITIDASSVIWLKKNKELLINGEPFDVKNITISGNKLILSGLFDLREKELKKQLEKYAQTAERSASTNNSLLLLFFTTYYQSTEPINLSCSFSLYTKPDWQKKQDNTCDLYHEIIVPPPRIS